LWNNTFEVTNFDRVITPVDGDEVEVFVGCAQSGYTFVGGADKESMEVNDSAASWVESFVVIQIWEFSKGESDDADIVRAKNKVQTSFSK
jgi:hypothetical protein